jgi:y4mF family transcriptional regulator
MLVQSIGLIVRERRRELKITQSSLADISNISKNTIYKFEKGQNNPSLKVVEQLLDVLGLELSVQPKSIEL